MHVHYIFLVGAGLSWLLFKMLHKQRLKNSAIETAQNEIITIKESLYKPEAEKQL